MTAHLLKTPAPVSDMRTRCGLSLSTDGEPKPPSGDTLGFEQGIVHVDCVGCLRDLIVDMRVKASGMPDTEVVRWLQGGDTGTSSQTIWSVMTGYPVDRTGVPVDPDDFGRCSRLLAKFPGWRARMFEVAAAYPAWTGLVAEWDALEALYAEELPTGMAHKLYERMKGLTRA